MKNARKQNISLLLFCTPALVVYILFKLYPALSGVFYSLTNWNGLKKEYDFVGLSNFIEILSDKYFWNSMWFTFKYVIVIVIVSNVAALTLAVAIESRRRAKGLYRTVFYMPNMISMVIGGYMWMFIFTKVLYYMADNWGWKFLDHSWIGDPKYSFIAIMIVAAWGATGYLMIIYGKFSPLCLYTVGRNRAAGRSAHAVGVLRSGGRNRSDAVLLPKGGNRCVL